MKKRESFSSGLAVFFATLGSAVGLGNIWKFPYLTGSNGGGAFVFVYLLCIILVGIPIMLCEFFIGRKSRKNAVGAFENLKTKPFWKVIGYLGILSSLLVMFFYSAVAGWVYSYVFKAIKGDFNSLSNQTISAASKITSDKFNLSVGGSWQPIVWQIIVLAVVAVILIAGVKNGIEKITKTLMPLLFVLIIICDIRGLTLSGSMQGLKFMFTPDFSKLTPTVVLSALGLSFFKLGIGMGSMITYGSYFTEDNNMISTSVKVALSDTLISLLAGVAIFPAVFTFGIEASGGPGLLFKTIPLVFAKVPFGNILIIAFFLLTSIAATTAMISIVEVPVAFLVEQKGLKRPIAVILSTSIIAIIGALTVHPKSLLGAITLGGKNLFDWFDYISSNITLPITGLLIAIFIGYIIKRQDFKYEISNKGTLNNEKIINIFIFIIRYITPALLIIVFLNSIGLIKFV